LTCQRLGKGYHLLSENEWLTLAENIIRVGENDVDEVKDGLQLATGTDRTYRTNGVDESGDGTDGSGSATTTGVAFVLSNGNVVYNLVGGVAEWTDQTVTGDGLPIVDGDGWQEYYNVEDYKGFNIAPPYYYTFADNRIGRIRVTRDASRIDADGTRTNAEEDYLRGFVRGATALYDLDLTHAPTEATSTIGFRCAR
jgi:formylglycine-generating enzyme required for sulfatase activity